MTARSCAAWPKDVPGYVEDAVAVVDRALALWPNGELALSFNGGKDCTILLGLVQVRHTHAPRPPPVPARSRAPYRASILFYCPEAPRVCACVLWRWQLSEARRKHRFAAEGKSLSEEETSSLFTSSVRMVYFVEEGCFPEQDEFIELTQRAYGFELQRVGSHMRENTAMLVRHTGLLSPRHSCPQPELTTVPGTGARARRPCVPYGHAPRRPVRIGAG